MERKLIFLDIDGTIYNRKKEIPEKTHMAINALKAQGHILAIASGRAPYTMTNVVKETGIKNYVCFNGQYVVYNEEVIFKNPLDFETLKALEHQAAGNDHPMVYFSETEAVSNVEDHHHIKESLESIKIAHPRYEENYYLNNEIYQALLFHDASTDMLYDDKYDKIKYYRWHEVSRDVVPFNGSKAVGIQKFAEHLGFDQKDTIAVGDGTNDFEMIAWAGTGIAMGNAVEGLKEIADYVTDDVDKDGLYKAFVALNMIGDEDDGKNQAN